VTSHLVKGDPVDTRTGQRMSTRELYKGGGFRVFAMSAGRWSWEVKPPLSVRGLHPQCGVTLGKRSTAVDAVKREIDTQLIRMLSQQLN